MYIKLIGENENGFPIDCTIGKIYEIAGANMFHDIYFYNDAGDKDFSYHDIDSFATGQWQFVDKEGNVL